jgi:hypothetical protein
MKVRLHTVLILRTRWRLVVNLMPQPLYPHRKVLIPTGYDTGWAPKPVFPNTLKLKYIPFVSKFTVT